MHIMFTNVCVRSRERILVLLIAVSWNTLFIFFTLAKFLIFIFYAIINHRH